VAGAVADQGMDISAQSSPTPNAFFDLLEEARQWSVVILTALWSRPRS